MNNSYKKVVEENKEFVEYMHLLFMHFYKIESLKEVVSPIYVGDNITKSISKELNKIIDCNYINKINVMTQDAIEFRMYVYDIFSQHWIFTVDIKNNIELTKSIRWVDSHINYMISKEDNRINLYNSSLHKEHVFIMAEKNIKEEIELIKLKYDINLSHLDLTDMFFKNVESLSFIRELK